MSQNQLFTIYNASAGSGKTFTLVKEYLKILFKSKNLEQFKRILAITFTNKAVAEMKERIIKMLKKFSDEAILDNPDSMFETICQELRIAPQELHEKSKLLLNTILHNYAAFDISTIDRFTHKLIRTFAYDLKLPLNFEVELDQDALLSEAVDSLISKAGTDAILTKVLVEFAIEKADDDKSWDVAFDFNKIAKLLTNENDIPFIETLKDKTLDDFKSLKTQLKKEIATTETAIVEGAESLLTLFQEAGLEFNDFTSGYLPKHFQKLADKNFDVAFGNKWQENLENGTLYPKRVSAHTASTIEQLQPQIVQAFNLTKQAVFHIKFLKAFYRNITPLSVLNAINNELNMLKIDQNKMLISEFNSIISKEICNQPTPFIYERLGEKFKHYFIDEFQDTSTMQWENLMPLLDNSLATESGSTMLVGDAKQAIYRWRGGKAEQFIHLFNKTSKPFLFEQNVKSLDFNYRSYKEVVNFNNGFFNYLASQVFSNDAYINLYENAKQTISKEEAGYVSLSFLNLEKEDTRDDVFCETVFKTIQNCLDNNFKLEDICVLVRKKKEGVAVANYLSQKNIPIISSETLLICNAPEVALINNILSILVQPKNNEIKVLILEFLASKFKIENKHDFFINHINLSSEQFFKSFETFNIHISKQQLLQLPLFDLAETIVRSFNLVEKSNAYIQFYLDVVLEFSNKKGSNISGFLEYFEKKKESLSIVSPVGQDAIQIMTIHKSKGLEFPVVIFPYADLDIYKEIEPKEWLPINKEVYNGFTHTLLNFNKDFENFGNVGHEIFIKHKSEQELDNINLLYVTLTRAVEQLYIISSNETTSKGDVTTKKYSGLFINYLQYLGVWNDSEINYTFGSQSRQSVPKFISSENTVQTEFISTSKESQNIKVVTKSGMLWDTNQEEAIEKGNLIHNIMAKIKTKDDVEMAISEYLNAAIISPEQAVRLKKIALQIVNHPVLEAYYLPNITIYNERDIIAKDGIILRPDRVVLTNENEGVIIDYKTGFEDKKHIQQLHSYQDVLLDMNIRIKKKILVYINDHVLVKEV
ncbi:UvrD-helicase domain-containing protein [Mariniflexile sp.]|uniref:UvrD-helicase domain-containing protein n=1 Tax=Mariniflexile sp. TaxID=1979402 RepID=UPI003561B9D2